MRYREFPKVITRKIIAFSKFLNQSKYEHRKLWKDPPGDQTLCWRRRPQIYKQDRLQGFSKRIFIAKYPGYVRGLLLLRWLDKEEPSYTGHYRS